MTNAALYQECFSANTGTRAILKKEGEATRCGSFAHGLSRESILTTNAPFDPQDETLCKGWSVRSLPKTNGSNLLLFPEVRQKSTCTDRECYRAKVEALVQSGEPLERKERASARFTGSRMADKRPCQRRAVEGQYRKAKAKGSAPTRSAVSLTARVLAASSILADRECDVHNA